MENSINYASLKKYGAVYSLRMPEIFSSRKSGDLGGKSIGNSIEYLDHKNYYPGDDIRHIDWKAYARSDKLVVKLYREEISPHIDIICDNSLSMNSVEKKRAMLNKLMALTFFLGVQNTPLTKIHFTCNPIQSFQNIEEALKIGLEQQEDPIYFLQGANFLKRRGVRIFISDFLFPFDPAQLISLFENSDKVFFIQILSGFEANPDKEEEIRLIEAENEQYMDIKLTNAMKKKYKKKLSIIQDSLHGELLKRNGAFSIQIASGSMDDTVEKLFQDHVLTIRDGV